MGNLITKSGIKREYGLTDRLIALIGEPDVTKPNPYYRQKGAPMQLFDRERVEAWIATNQALIIEAKPQQKRAQKAVETKRQAAQTEIDNALEHLELRPIPRDIKQCTHRYLSERYHDFDGVVTNKAIVAHIRHNYTNYEAVLAQIKGKVGAGDLYQQIRAVLDQRIIEYYGYSPETE